MRITTDTGILVRMNAKATGPAWRLLNVILAAVAGRADALCAMDRDFYGSQVISFCRESGIKIMNDVELLKKLR